VNKAIDLRFENQFSVVLIRPVTVRGAEWIKERVIVDPWQWLGRAVAVEPNVAAEIFLVAKAGGLGLRVADYNGQVEQV